MLNLFKNKFMKKINIVVSKNTNYIYHMLSVSKCGYENQYGEKFKNIHHSTDLKILKKNERLLTVVGGSHFGRLYSVFVSTPAAIEEDSMFIRYFEGLKDLFSNNNPIDNYDKYKDVYQTAYTAHRFIVTQQSSIDFYNFLADIKDTVVEICDIFINNYSKYNKYVWKRSMKELKLTKRLLQKKLDSDINTKWENILNHKYPYGEFEVLLCNSISDGVQAIDIGYNKDVFDAKMDIASIIQYISHEVGIYILRDLFEHDGIDFHSNYHLIESVIEYFNPIENVSLEFSDNQGAVTQYIESIESKDPTLSVYEIIKVIIKTYNEAS